MSDFGLGYHKLHSESTILQAASSQKRHLADEPKNHLLTATRRLLVNIYVHFHHAFDDKRGPHNTFSSFFYSKAY